jgi:hypothetical protein
LAQQEQTPATIALCSQLSNLNTTEFLIDGILYYLQSNHAPQASPFQHPKLQEVVQEQLTIDSYSIALGHLSKKWQELYNSSFKNAKSRPAPTWSKTIVLSLWKYSKDIWWQQNKLVHGEGVRNTSQKELQDLQHKAKEFY